MQHRTARRAISAFMAFVLILTCNSATFQPLMAMADGMPDAVSSEDAGMSAGKVPVVDRGGAPADGDQGTVVPDAVDDDKSTGQDAGAPDAPAPEGGQEPAAPRDLGDDEGVAVELAGLAYVDVEGAAAFAPCSDGVVDASGVDPLLLEGAELRFKVTAQPGTAHAGDTLALAVPQAWCEAPSDADLARAGAQLGDRATLGIADGGLTLTFADAAAEATGPFELTVAYPLSLAEGVLGDEPVTVEVPLKGGATAELTLPAAPTPAADEPAVEGDGTQVSALAAAPLMLGDSQPSTTNVVLEKEWRDNNDANRPWQKIATDGTLAVWFTVDGGTETKLDENTMGQLGLSSVPKITAASSGTSHSTYTCAGLPAQTVDGGSVSYVIKEDVPKALALGYVQQKEQDGPLYNVKTTTFTANVVVRAGGKKEDLGNIFSLFAGENEIKGSEVEWSFDKATGTGTYTMKNLPMYDLNGDAITYHATAPEPADKTQDYYYPEYDNAKVPNHGTDVDKCYDGGTINLTLAGEASFTGKKVWLDGNASAEKRPDATFHLWRYTAKGGNGFAQASQVRDDSNAPIAVALTGTDKEADSFAFTIEAGDLFNLKSLPKYDAEGYPYVYLVRETLSGGVDPYDYEQVFGLVDEHGVVHDTSATGEGDWTGRADTDKSLYNGGTLSNRRTGNVTVEQQKTWKAAVYQNQISDVTVEFTLQQRLKGGDEWVPARPEKKETMKGFIAEVMTKSVTATAPQYDELGHELEYRWAETSVMQGDDDRLKTSGDGVLTFELDCNKAANQADEDAPEHFTSTEEPKAKGSDDTWIVNRLEGTVDYTIDKLWRVVDETGDPLYPEGDERAYGKIAPVGASITVGIFQDGKLFKTYEMDGERDKAEIEAWHVYVTDLPKYDDEGRLHSYIAEEVKGYDGWFSTYTHDLDNRITNIRNDPGTKGNRIRVAKEWIDDGDVDHRYPVTVEVHERNDDGSAGAKVKDGTVTLSAANNWWAWVGVPENTNYENYVLVETALVGEGGAVYKPDEERGPLTVTTDKHIYQVTSGQNDEMKMLTVTNKRIGTIDLTVTKKWLDQGADKGTRHNAQLKLVCVEYPEAVEGGKVVLPHSGELPILNGDGKTPVSSVQTVDKTVDSGAETSYYFYNLPKYDSNGKVVHYAIEEVGDDGTSPFGKDTDYKAFITQDGYEVGDTHTNDKQAISVKNKRVGTKDVEFHKLWKDAYAYKNGKRPDIYLTLWQKDSVHTGLEQLRYVDHQWTARAMEPADPQNEWTAAFEDMPKYDDNGAEITYYAQESTNVNAADFDYTAATYQDDGRNSVKVGDAGEWVLKPGDVTVLKEGGTFVNAIERNVTIEGKKKWENIPAGFPSAQLPKLDIYLDQYLGKSKTEGIASLSGLETREGTNEFTFTIEKDSKGAELPKYNDEGELYSYGVHEVIQGTPEDLSIWETIYPSQPGVVLTLENVFNTGAGNVESLKVEKIWKDHPAGKAYPVATFKLHRLYDKSGQADPVDEVVATKKLVSTSDTGEFVTFDNLLVHAPDGQKYRYYVEEVGIDGFGAVISGASKDNPAKLGNKDIVTASVTNTYQPDTIVLNGSKEWNDYGNAFKLRPADLTITLHRWADPQNGQNNPVLSESVDLAGKVSWTKTDANKWTYSIAALDKVAPNGMPWIYQVTETVPDKYKAEIKSVQTSADTADPLGAVQLGALKNELGAQASATKVWEDGDDAYKLRPTTVHVKLQVSIDGGAWQDASGMLSAMTFYAFEADLNAGNVWKHTFGNLPPATNADGSLKPLTYRVVETMIGDDGHIAANDDGTYSFTDGKTHTYTPSGKVEGEETVITNTMTGKTTLTVEKTWNDENNRFGTRPVGSDGSTWEITVKLQRSTDVSDESKWSDVLQSDGITVLTEAIAGDSTSAGTTEAKFENLPKYDKDGNELFYRAVEDPKAPAYEKPVHGYDVKSNTTSITNSLTTVEIDGTKTWSDAGTQGERPNEVHLKLLCRIGKGAWDKAPSDPTPSWKDMGTDKWSYKYVGLPKFDRMGDEYEYSVEEDVPAGYWASYDGLKVTNTATNFTLKKLDSSGNPLEGATFTVVGKIVNGDGSVGDGSITLSGKSDATVTGRLIAGETYTVTETVPPDGCIAAASFTVLMKADGTIAAKDALLLPDGVSIEEHAVVVKDAPNRFSFQKVDQSGSPLAGAKLKLEGEFADGSKEKSWESHALNAEELVGQLIAGETYTLTETERLPHYLPLPGAVKFKPTEAGTLVLDDGNPSYGDGSPAATLSDDGLMLSVRNVKVRGVATLKKVDAETHRPLNDVTFSLFGKAGELVKEGLATGNVYNAADWSSAAAPDGQLTVEGLDLGDYYFKETAAAGYKVSDDELGFTVDPVKDLEGLSAELEIGNKPIVFSFGKVELYAESCSDPVLGAVDPADTRPLAGAEFRLFADEACMQPAELADGSDAVATSNLGGTVRFERIAAGSYFMKETAVPQGHVDDGTVYALDVSADGGIARFAPVGQAEGALDQVVNDVPRADIRIKKVSETDESKVLPNSVYGLFKRVAPEPLSLTRAVLAQVPASEGGLQLVAKATTGPDGYLMFEGILMNTEYVIQELEAPDGSLVSKNPVKLTFEVGDDGAPRIVAFEDGSGTAKVDEDGNIVWREPQVTVGFAKTDPAGALLANARLQVVDEDGAVAVEPWTSSADGEHLVEGVLVAGKTYRLVELEAPEGYRKAADVEFAVEDPKLGPDEGYVQHVAMVDERTPASTASASSGRAGKLSRTGDPAAQTVLLVGGIALAGIVVAGAASLRRRRKA